MPEPWGVLAAVVAVGVAGLVMRWRRRRRAAAPQADDGSRWRGGDGGALPSLGAGGGAGGGPALSPQPAPGHVRIAFDIPAGVGAEEARTFPLGVAGESFDNADGSSRQAIIRRATIGEAVDLVPEPDNPHDDEAVAVMRRGRGGGQIGYLPRGHRLARQVAADRVRAVIAAVNGGTPDKPTLGVVLGIAAWPMPKVPRAPRAKRQRRK